MSRYGAGKKIKIPRGDGTGSMGMGARSGRAQPDGPGPHGPFESIDINAHTGEIVNITKVGKATAWKDVPTPAI